MWRDGLKNGRRKEELGKKRRNGEDNSGILNKGILKWGRRIVKIGENLGLMRLGDKGEKIGYGEEWSSGFEMWEIENGMIIERI